VFVQSSDSMPVSNVWLSKAVIIGANSLERCCSTRQGQGMSSGSEALLGSSWDNSLATPA